MDNIDLRKLSSFFKIFGDETRLKIINQLINSELSVSEIAESLKKEQSAISHQLKILRQNRLVKKRRDGKSIYYSLDDQHVETIFTYGLTHIKEEK